MMKFLTAVLFLILGSANDLFAADYKLPVPEVEIFPNGLQVVWFLNDHLPVVDINWLAQSGYRDDVDGKSGTAALVSSALERGAGGMNAQQLAHAFESLGAIRYVVADDDTFGVGAHGLAPDATVLAELVAKLVIHPDFPEPEVERERAKMLERWNHVGDTSETLSSLAFSRIMTSGTSYGRGSFLTTKELKKITRDDIVEYHHKHFTPKNSILMIVGRVEKASFRKKILELFGLPEVWQGEAPKREWKNFSDQHLPRKSGQVVVVDRPELTQAQVRIGFQAPSIQAPEHYALMVGNALLGEYFNSRLNSLIRDKLGLTYAIGSSFLFNRDYAYFNIISSTRSERAGQLIRKTLDTLRDLKKGPISQDEVKTAKEYLVGGFPLSTSTLSAVATRWLVGSIFNLGPNYLNEFVPKVSAITEPEVQQAVSKDFDLEHLVIVVAGDAKEIEKSLKEAKINSVRRVSVTDLL